MNKKAEDKLKTNSKIRSTFSSFERMGVVFFLKNPTALPPINNEIIKILKIKYVWALGTKRPVKEKAETNPQKVHQRITIFKGVWILDFMHPTY